MTILRIFQVFDFFKSGTAHQAEMSSGSKPEERETIIPQRTYVAKDGSVQIDRRGAPDRRHRERRKTNSRPYLDTRKNNGRRRSFGRRSRDLDSETVF
jgi:hypothetical protein